MTYRKFHYQLQGAQLDKLSADDSDLYILDPQKGDGTYWKPGELREVTNNGKAKALCYLSVGEAEDYRSYWNPFADYVGQENPDWKGNYRAKFWMPEWQEIVFKQLDVIMKMGFDGAYLDVVDVYQYWEEQGRERMAMLMLEFIKDIAERAKKNDSTFLIIPQNAPDLLEYRAYVNIIDGIGIENYLYDEDDAETSEEHRRDVDWCLRFLGGKPVFATEYATVNPDDTVRVLRERGFVPLVTSRELDKNPDEVTR